MFQLGAGTQPCLGPPEIAEHTIEDPFEPLSVRAMVCRIADMALQKAVHPWAFLMRSVVGGAMVGFGTLLSLVVSTGVGTPGIASLLMGLAFGMSFVLILVSGMSLITADMAAGFLAVLQRRMSWDGYLRLLTIGLTGNLVGVLAFVTVCAAAGGPYLGGFAARAATVGVEKVSQPFWTAFLLAVLCTWFLQTAMCLYYKARSDVARMGFAFYGPCAFVMAGTQHVVANVGFLGLPMLLSVFHASAPHPAIAWGLCSHGLLTNICVTGAGNLVGGTLFVAVPFYIIGRLQPQGIAGPV